MKTVRKKEAAVAKMSTVQLINSQISVTSGAHKTERTFFFSQTAPLELPELS